MTKQMTRSEASALRRKALHAGRVQAAPGSVERISAAVDYLRAQLLHVPPEVAERAAARVAAVILAAAESLEADRTDRKRR